MEADKSAMLEKQETETPESPPITRASSENSKPLWIEPDLDFIHVLSKRSGNLFMKCMQCGTCSATCSISPDTDPFPRKEMAWAVWGLKDLLLKDPDVWLCYQCNDCSTGCPRGARPGDMLADVRKESIQHYAFPRFLARWVSQPQYIPFLLGIPAALLSLALFTRDTFADAFGITNLVGREIVYSYSSMFPRWLLNGFFMLICLLVLIAIIVGLTRFWRAMKQSGRNDGNCTPVKGRIASILSALKNVIAHTNFDKCTAAHSRTWSHRAVFFGFAALTMVTLWVITARYNPFIQNTFVYPFGFWSPWKILANLGGLALVGGCLWMIRDRLLDKENAGASTFFDWALVATLLLVGLTGFITEVMHYVRLEPHRHVAYFVHLVFACALIMYLPYSKFGHLIYRTTAMVYAERYGRNLETRSTEIGEIPDVETEEKSHAV